MELLQQLLHTRPCFNFQELAICKHSFHNFLLNFKTQVFHCRGLWKKNFFFQCRITVITFQKLDDIVSVIAYRCYQFNVLLNSRNLRFSGKYVIFLEFQSREICLRGDAYMTSTFKDRGVWVKVKMRCFQTKKGGDPIFIFFIKENWICTVTRHHAEPNTNILLTRNLPVDSHVRQ